MSDIDLSAAIRAGISAGDKVNPRLYPASDVAVAVSREAVLAAAPLIEAAVREQIARDIEARRADLLDPATPGYLNIRDAGSWVTGTRWAAGIALGDRR